MSYILEALRKVEQQREYLPAHALSSRRRYYSAIDARTWSHSWILAIVAVVGATVSGGVVAYLSTDGERHQPLQQQDPQQPVHQPSIPTLPPAAAVNHTLQSATSPVATPGTSPPLQSVSAAPLRMPGPRYQPQNKAEAASQSKPAVAPQNSTVVQPQRKIEALPQTAITQNGQPQESKPVTSPEQEGPPETKQPTAPADEQETEVASVHPPSNGVKEQSRFPPAAQKRATPSRFTNTGDAMDRIAAPKAVEVQPFRPNDVVRPPAARKSASPTSGEPPMLSTLSSQYQSMVPKMAVNAQVYSPQPQQRFVVINMKRYNEGQSTAEGVNIVAIRKEDIIFSYQGQHFRMGR